MKDKLLEVLGQSAWRLRAYLGSQEVSGERVGWRGDPAICPLAEWLEAEAFRAGAERVLVGVVGDEASIFIDEAQAWLLPVPRVLQIFQDLIDGAVCYGHVQLAWTTSRVTRQEALAALALAERRADQLANQMAITAPRCAAPGCHERVITPQVEGFLHAGPRSSPGREECYQFAGGLCRSHIANIIAAPDTWWEPEAAQARQLVGAAR
jgi:hypothetical protein